MQYEDLSELKEPAKSKKIVYNNVFKLGEYIHSLRYWGQEQKSKNKSGCVTAMFICECGKAFRATITNVAHENTTSCGCKRKKK